MITRFSSFRQITPYTHLMILVISISSLCFVPNHIKAQSAQTPVQAHVETSATVSIYGYSSPFSLISAEGFRSYAQTNTDAMGYYQFDAIPLSGKTEELCITSVDQDQITSFPVCLTPSRSSNTSMMGPVILPPTLSLRLESASGSEHLVASGRSIPLTTVSLSLFPDQVERGLLIPRFFGLIAYASSPQKVRIQTSEDGSYYINLNPNTKTRLFSTVLFHDELGPKSNTLSFNPDSLPRNSPWSLILLILVLTGWGGWITSFLLERFRPGNRRNGYPHATGT